MDKVSIDDVSPQEWDAYNRRRINGLKDPSLKNPKGMTDQDVENLPYNHETDHIRNVSKQLNASDISCEVVNCRFIKPMDEAYLRSMKNKFSNIITVEEGTVVGGFGDGVSSWLLDPVIVAVGR